MSLSLCFLSRRSFGMSRSLRVPPLEEYTMVSDTSQDDPDEKKQIEVALKNFALVAIQVDAFEYLELAETPNRRTQWTRQDDGSWEERKVAP
jgi:hypothetical protein